MCKVMNYALEWTPTYIHAGEYLHYIGPMPTRSVNKIEAVFDNLVRGQVCYLRMMDEMHDKDDAWRSDRLALQVLHHLYRRSGRNWFWKPVFVYSDPGYCDYRPQTVDEMCADLAQWYRDHVDRLAHDPDKLQAGLDFIRAHLR